MTKMVIARWLFLFIFLLIVLIWSHEITRQSQYILLKEREKDYVLLRINTSAFSRNDTEIFRVLK